MRKIILRIFFEWMPKQVRHDNEEIMKVVRSQNIPDVMLFEPELYRDERGYFYYQVTPYYKNKISYMRWSQAWMLLALSTLLQTQNS